MEEVNITYTQEAIADLDIRDTYKELMEASTGQGSAYLKAKETLQDIFDNDEIDGATKAEVISNTVAQIAVGVTSKAMDTALAIELANRNGVYELTKLKEDTKLVTAQANKVAQDDEKAQAETDAIVWDNYKRQASLVRDWGVTAYLLNPETDTVVPQIDYISDGTKYQENNMAKASLYTTYAKSFRQDGVVTPVVDMSTGYMTSAAGTLEGQSYWQNEVTERQYKGFDDNMRQHVANSSASMISMLLSTEEAGIDYTPYLSQWNSALTYLNNTEV